MFENEDLNEKLSPALYLVPTPIGNVEDITLRALKVLANADIVACEDTRTSAVLLKKIGVHALQLTSYHEYNEREKAPQLAKLIEEGKSIALISDAGMPALSDPGYRLINETIGLGQTIVPLPGANALLPALAASGFPTNEFMFMGFPPQKKGRKTYLERLASRDCTVIAYESTHRIAKFIGEIAEYCGEDRRVCIAREISKIYEEFIRGTAGEVRQIVAERKELKGEIVVVVERQEEKKMPED